MRAENEPKPNQSQGEQKEVNLLDPILSMANNVPFHLRNWNEVVFTILGVELKDIKPYLYENKKP